MKGATADPWLRTIKKPNKASTIIIGNNQYFFLSFKKSKNSFIKLIIKIVFSLHQYLFLSLANKKILY